MMKLLGALPLVLLSFGSLAHAQTPVQPSPPPPMEATAPAAPIKRIGVGYKLGNGIGFAGADLILTALPNITLDLQVAAVTGFDSGFAVAPAVQGYLRPRGNSPYVGIGLQHVRVTLGDSDASGTGYFANIGYEWKWNAGLGILLGGGVQYLDEVTVNNGVEMATVGGGVNPNIEFGLRYRFL